MGRIGEAAVGECVAQEQITIFIMDARDRHWQLWEDRKADTDDDEEKCDDRGRPALREARRMVG